MTTNVELTYDELVDTALANRALFEALFARREDAPADLVTYLAEEWGIAISKRDAKWVQKALTNEAELASSMQAHLTAKEFLAQVRWRT